MLTSAWENSRGWRAFRSILHKLQFFARLCFFVRLAFLFFSRLSAAFVVERAAELHADFLDARGDGLLRYSEAARYLGLREAFHERLRYVKLLTRQQAFERVGLPYICNRE